MKTVEQKRQELVNDWFDCCQQDRDFLISILEERVNDLYDSEVKQAWQEAGLGNKKD